MIQSDSSSSLEASSSHSIKGWTFSLIIGSDFLNHVWMICSCSKSSSYKKWIILAIMGKKNIHLVESDQKKCVFLREIAMLTNLDITIHNCRIENLTNIDVDMITCRALAPLNKLIDYVEFFLSKSSKKKKKFPKLLFLKGKNYRKELLELSTNKKIYFKEYPSLTDKYGKILYINKIDMLNFYNEQ